MSPDPLLHTKFFIPPPRATRVTRPRLIEQLDEGLTRGLVLIAAPAGFGKTTLVGDWNTTHKPRLVWLALDQADNDPVRFATYLLAAFEQVHDDVDLFRNLRALLHSPQPPSLEAVLISIVNIFVQEPLPLVLVLDDYHVITLSALHEGLTFLLDHLPSGLRVILCTRADPPLPLARWRARGQLTELRALDLRFTTEEALTFLNQTMGLQLSDANVAALEARTEGWIAGLQLAALAMQPFRTAQGAPGQLGSRDADTFVQTFAGSHRFIVDYLAEEVLQNQPEAIQQFLLQTSILGRLSGSLCDTVMERVDSQRMLETLERSNLFVLPLDETRAWYRYHHLFADLLRHRVQGQVALVSELHQRASKWYEHNGFVAEAIHHAFGAQDFERAAQLIEGDIETMMKRGEYVTLQQWLERLPVEQVRARPRLLLGHAWTLVLTHNLDAAETALLNAERVCETRISDPAAHANFLGEVAAIRSAIAYFRGDHVHSIELARQGLPNLSSENERVRGQVFYWLGQAHHRMGNLQDAINALTEAHRIGLAGGDTHTALRALTHLGHVRWMRGHFRAAMEIFEQTLALAARYGAQHLPILASVHYGLAVGLYDWNELESSVAHLQAAIERSQTAGMLLNVHSSMVTLAFALDAQGDSDGAFQMMLRASQLLSDARLSPGARDFYYYIQVLLWLKHGELAAAMEWAQNNDLPVTTFTPDTELGHLARARVLLAQTNFDAALELLSQLLAAAQVQERAYSVLMILVLQANVLYSSGARVQALTTLERALTLAEPEGYIRTIVDEGEPMRVLLSEFGREFGGNQPQQLRMKNQVQVTHDVQTHRLLAYVNKLLAAFPQSDPVGTPILEIKNSDVSRAQGLNAPEMLFESLSERERQVLGLVAEGLSDREIAERIIVSTSTVKKHLLNIYSKLQVHSRTEALARAKKLSLL
jgi:LuxR family transcriptional regulator, maltose regulon positive regulatory protein